MSKTPISSVSTVLGEFWLYGRKNLEDREWQEFVEDNESSLALAYLLSTNAITISDNASGELAVSDLYDAWNLFCAYLNIPNDLTYRDLQDAYDSIVWVDGVVEDE